MDTLDKFGLDATQTKDLTQQLETMIAQVELAMKKVKRQVHKALQNLLSDLKAGIAEVDKLLRDAFTVDSAAKLQKGASIYGQTLALSLYGIQADLEGLRSAIIRAASPIAALFVPLVKQAIGVLTSLANSIYRVLSALLGGTGSLREFTGSANAAVSAGTALKRTLAGFDEINRLGSKTGFSALSGELDQLNGPVSDKVQAVTDKLRALLAPLLEIDLTPLSEAFGRLREALEPIKKTLFAGLEWAWENLLVPLAKWTVEDVLPKFLDAITAAMEGLNRIITELQPEITWLWDHFLKPLAQWAGTAILAELQQLTQYLGGVGDWVSDNQGPVDTFIGSVKEAVGTMSDMNVKAEQWNKIGPLASAVANGLGQAATAMSIPMGNTNAIFTGLGQTLGGLILEMEGLGTTGTDVWQQLQQTWGGTDEWVQKDVTDPVAGGVRDVVNLLIGFLNQVIKAVADTVNMVIGALNQLSFTVPKWVPLIGGNRFGFDLKHVTAPQIPYLAKGAVLPANRPFMAVVGDQKHGTNVEAPLATIQEALQSVLESELGGVMAGFRAVTERQERILDAICSMELSDAALSGAVDRHHQKMAVINGGLW